jgi:hypothetical protein
MDIDAPQISTLREEDSPPPPSRSNNRFRVKLVVKDAAPAEEEVEEEEDEEDQLIDDDVEMTPAKKKTPPKRKPRKKSAEDAKEKVSAQSAVPNLAPTISWFEANPSEHYEDVPTTTFDFSPSAKLKAGRKAGISRSRTKAAAK